MRQLLILSTALFLFVYADAQDCNSLINSHAFTSNQIRCRVGPSGYLFEPDSAGAYRVIPPEGGEAVRTIQSMSLWIGGLDPGGNLHMYALPEGEGVAGYLPGALNRGDRFFPGGSQEDPERGKVYGSCENWNRVWAVTREELLAFRADLEDDGYLQDTHLSVLAWPGQGNPFFEAIHGFQLPFGNDVELASFYDQNFNGRYEPHLGDYPCLPMRSRCNALTDFPDELTWMVYHTAKREERYGMPLEIQQFNWVYNCADDPLMNNTVFTQLAITNVGIEDMDSLYIGILQEPTLGCATDDYIGCFPQRDQYYFYNSDAIDGDIGDEACQESGITVFPGKVPIQGVEFGGNYWDFELETFTYWSDSLMVRSDAFGMPDDLVGYYNVLSGRSKDGVYYSAGSDGYDPASEEVTSLLFPDIPTDTAGWSMATANVVPGVDRVMSAVKYVDHRDRATQLRPDFTIRVNAAFVTYFQPELSDSLAWPMAILEMNRVNSDMYYGHGSLVCRPLPVTTQEVQRENFLIFPNPTQNRLTVKKLSSPVIKYDILTLSGQPIATREGYWQDELHIEVADFTSGLYLLRLQLANGEQYIQKWVRAE